MEVDTPPKPPDPGGSQNHGSQAASRKRPSEENVPAAESVKKNVSSDPSQTFPSIQSIFLNPQFIEGPKEYNKDDKGPYIVHVSREVSDPSAGITIRPLKFGQYLHIHKFSNIVSDGVKSVGRNKISVEFSTVQSANDFLTNKILTLSKYKAAIPTFNITRMGLVRGVPVDWSMEEFVSSLELPTGCGVVLKARRLNRKTINGEGKLEWVPTQSVVMTFRGQMLPSKIFSFYTSLPVEHYKYPTIQCLNCCRFGHIKTQCRSKPRCYRCAQPHAGDACVIPKEKASCLHCSGCHFTSDKSCPEFSRQQNIKLIMSQENISYSDASTRFPPVRRSYAEMAREMFSTPQSIYSPLPSNSSLPANLSHSKTTNSQRKSYKETVLRSPRSRASSVKGYDKQAHQNIVTNPSSSLPNGFALGNSQDKNPLPQSKMLEDLSSLLLSIIAPCCEIPLPTNVAQNLNRIFEILNNASNNSSSVEQ